ncbi:phosphohydrolase [Gordonia insulae]|uniref:Uncharacterized protein n=1 Tax=Gordonia insulae TaxID=2420509 RepID=A0A3G8JNE1_9ACTN|nr:phosphohydrolase [Gordonia insulae]AZG46458.1 hypothetical protein D7316_03059 [Gordonia insulae]
MTDDHAATDPENLLRLWAECGYDAEQVWAEIGRGDDRVRGPEVNELTARLSTVPGWFLTDPIRVRALAGDVLGDGDNRRDVGEIARLTDELDDPAARTMAGLCLWLWASEEVIGPYSRALRRDLCGRALAAFAFRLAAVVPARDLIGLAERREEAARTFLLWSGQRPGSEDMVTAHSLLDARDSLTRNAYLAEALVQQEHRLAVARRLAEARAREATARYGAE